MSVLDYINKQKGEGSLFFSNNILAIEALIISKDYVGAVDFAEGCLSGDKEDMYRDLVYINIMSGIEEEYHAYL
jgi:hypothetical protein